MQGLSLFNCMRHTKLWLVLLGFAAVAIHALLLHHWIDLTTGQNLTAFNMLSLVVWLIALLVLFVILFKPLDMLTIFIFPLAMLSILLVVGFPSRFIIATDGRSSELFHILLSVITFAVMCMAGLQAILLAVQQRILRLKPAGTLLHKLPPLITMEKLLFQTIAIGFVLLSLLLVTSLYAFYAVLLRDSVILQKTVIVVVAWVIIGLLLLGRYLWGWRGRKAIYCTFSGVLLLLIVYFGSKLMFLH